MNLSVSLGMSTGQASIRKNKNFEQRIPEPPSPRKSRTRSSPRKLRRNRARAQVYHEKKKLEFEKACLSTVSDTICYCRVPKIISCAPKMMMLIMNQKKMKKVLMMTRTVLFVILLFFLSLQDSVPCWLPICCIILLNIQMIRSINPAPRDL